MTTKKIRTSAVRNRKRNDNGKARTYRDSIRRCLSKVPGVDAVYISRDYFRVIHVTSVVQTGSESLYDALMPQEERVAKGHPKLRFDFHVRYRQWRSVDSAIPPGVLVVFKKNDE